MAILKVEPTTDIPKNDIEISRSSYVDPNGFVFTYRGQLLRAIVPDQEAFYRTLFRDGIIQELIEKAGLVSTEISPYTISELNCPLVLKHHRIEPESYCVEWCGSMLKAAALNTLDLCIILNKHNLMLQDAYPWNVFFDGTKTTFIDLTSIIPTQKDFLWPAFEQFTHFFTNPLELICMGKGKVARALLLDPIDGISNEELLRHLSLGYVLRHPLKSIELFTLTLMTKYFDRHSDSKKNLVQKMNSQAKNHLDQDTRQRFFMHLKKKILGIKIPDSKSAWRAYYQERRESAFPTDDQSTNGWSQKQKKVLELLRRIRPEQVTDVGCNTGWYSVLAAREGIKTIAIDSDEACIDVLYQAACHEKLALLPLVLNLSSPTPAFGCLAAQFPTALQRLKSPLVLALAVIHHMHIRGRQNFDQIAQLLKSLGDQAIIEYIDPEDIKIKAMEVGRSIDYNMDSVLSVFKKYFNTIEVFDSDVETRKILYCHGSN